MPFPFVILICLDSSAVVVIQIFNQFLFEVIHGLEFLQIQERCFYKSKKFSITALSKQFPFRLMLCQMPFSLSMLWYISIQKYFNSTTGEWMEMPTFYNIFNKWYARQTLEKIRAIWKSRAEHEKRVSPTVPFGYVKVDIYFTAGGMIDIPAEKEIRVIPGSAYGRNSCEPTCRARGCRRTTESNRYVEIDVVITTNMNSTL